MAERSVSVRLTVRNVEEARRQLLSLGKEGQQALQKIEGGAAPARRALLQIEGAVTRVDRSLSGLRRSTGFLAGSLAAVTAGLSVRTIVDAAISYERMENTLRAASGSAAAAADDLGYLRSEAERLGLDLQTLSSQFARFSAASRGTAMEGLQTREIFSAVAETSRVLGLNIEQTEGTLRAFEQMVSKGTVQAEELRGQLGERLPGAFQIAARAMGVTTRELEHMTKASELATEDLLPRFAAELRKTFGPEVGRAANSAQAQIARFNTALFNLRVEFARSGFLDAVVMGMNELKDVLSDPDFRAGMVAFGAWVRDAIKYLVDHASEIATSATVLAGAWAGMRIGRIAGPTGALVGAGVGGLAAAFMTERDTLLGERERTIESLEEQQRRLLGAVELDPGALKQLPLGALREAALTGLVEERERAITGLEQQREQVQAALSGFELTGQEGEVVDAVSAILEQGEASMPRFRAFTAEVQELLAGIGSMPPGEVRNQLGEFIEKNEALLVEWRGQVDQASQALQGFVAVTPEQEDRRVKLEAELKAFRDHIQSMEEEQKHYKAVLESFDVLTPKLQKDILVGVVGQTKISAGGIKQILQGVTGDVQAFDEAAARRSAVSLLEGTFEKTRESIGKIDGLAETYQGTLTGFEGEVEQRSVIQGLLDATEASLPEVEALIQAIRTQLTTLEPATPEFKAFDALRVDAERMLQDLEGVKGRLRDSLEGFAEQPQEERADLVAGSVSLTSASVDDMDRLADRYDDIRDRFGTVRPQDAVSLLLGVDTATAQTLSNLDTLLEDYDAKRGQFVTPTEQRSAIQGIEAGTMASIDRLGELVEVYEAEIAKFDAEAPEVPILRKTIAALREELAEMQRQADVYGRIVDQFDQMKPEERGSLMGDTARETGESTAEIIGYIHSLEANLSRFGATAPRLEGSLFAGLERDTERSYASIQSLIDKMSTEIGRLSDLPAPERVDFAADLEKSLDDAMTTGERKLAEYLSIIEQFSEAKAEVPTQVMGGVEEAYGLAIEKIGGHVQTYLDHVATLEGAAPDVRLELAAGTVEKIDADTQAIETKLAEARAFLERFSDDLPSEQVAVLTGLIRGLENDLQTLKELGAVFRERMAVFFTYEPPRQEAFLGNFERDLAAGMARIQDQAGEMPTILEGFKAQPVEIESPTADLAEKIAADQAKIRQQVAAHLQLMKEFAKAPTLEGEVEVEESGRAIQAALKKVQEELKAVKAEAADAGVIALPEMPNLTGAARSGFEQLQHTLRVQQEALAQSLEETIQNLHAQLQQAEEELRQFDLNAAERLSRIAAQGGEGVELKLAAETRGMEQRRAPLVTGIGATEAEIRKQTDALIKLRSELDKIEPGEARIRKIRALSQKQTEAQAEAEKELAKQRAAMGSILAALGQMEEKAYKDQLELAELRATTVENLKIEVEQLHRLAEAEAISAEKADEVRAQIEAENIARELQAGINTTLAETIEALVIARAKENVSIKASQDAREDAAAERDRLNREAERERERLAEEAREIALAPFETALENMQNLATDTFEKIYSGGLDSFEDLADSVKQIWFRLMAELTTLSIIRPEIAWAEGSLLSTIFGKSAATAIPAAAGAGSTAAAGLGLAFQGTSAFMGQQRGVVPPSAAAAGLAYQGTSSFMNPVTAQASIGTAADLAQLGGLGVQISRLTGAINTFGHNTLGLFGSNVFGAGSATSATLSGTLGAAGLGYMGGGTLAKILGLGETGGGIGGGIGAGIGFAAGGPFTAALGAAIGSVIAGSIEKLIGGSDRKPEVTITTGEARPFQTSGGVPVSRQGPFGPVGLADIGTRGIGGDAVAQISEFIAAFDEEVGEVLTDRQREIATRLLQDMESEPVQFRKFNLGEEGYKLLRPRAEQILKAVAPQADPLKVFEGINVQVDDDTGENVRELAERLIEAAEAMELFNELTGKTEPETELTRALETLREGFDKLRKSAGMLGLDIGKIDQAQAQAEKKLEMGLREELRLMAQGGTAAMSQMEQAVVSLQARVKELRAEARALGLDPKKVVDEPARKAFKAYEAGLRENLRALARGEDGIGEYSNAVDSLTERFRQARREAKALGIDPGIVAEPERKALKGVERDIREHLRALAQGGAETDRWSAAIQNLTATFRDMRRALKELGVSTKIVDEPERKAIQGVRQDLREHLRTLAQAGGETNRWSAAIKTLEKEFADARKAAKNLGIKGDIVSEPERKAFAAVRQDFLEHVKTLAESADETDKWTSAIRNLKKEFADARKAAKDLGIKGSVIDAAERQAFGAIEKDLRKTVQALVDGTNNASRFSAQIRDLNTEFEAAAQGAKALGLSAGFVNDARAKALANIRREFVDEVNALANQPLPEFANAVRDLNAQIKAFTEDAKALGLDPSIVTKAGAEAMRALRTDFLAELNDLAGSGLTGILRDLEEMIARFRVAQEEALALGISVAEVREIEARALKNFKREALDRLSADLDSKAGEILGFFKDILDPLYNAKRDLTFGSLSVFSPQEQMRRAQAEFEETSRKAREGNIKAIEALPEAASTLVDAARLFGASPEQARAFAQVTQVLDKVINTQEALRDEFSAGIPELIDENRENTRQMVEAMSLGLDALRLEFIRTQRILEQRLGTLSRTA